MVERTKSVEEARAKIRIRRPLTIDVNPSERFLKLFSKQLREQFSEQFCEQSKYRSISGEAIYRVQVRSLCDCHPSEYFPMCNKSI